MSGFFCADADRWPAIARMLTASGQRWEDDAIVVDLQWWADRVKRWHDTGGRDGEPRIPDRRAMAKRWGVTEWKARKMLAAEGDWKRWLREGGDDAAPTRSSPGPLPVPSRCPPGALPVQDGANSEIEEDSPGPLPVPSLCPPGALHTRGSPTPDHPTPSTREANARAPAGEPPSVDGPSEASADPEALTAAWEAITGRAPGMVDLLALEALPRRIEDVCRRQQIELYAHPGEIALDVLRWVRDATDDVRWGADRAAFVRRRWKAEDGRVTSMLDNGQIAQLVSRWLPAWRAAVASGAAGSQADTDRARAAWDDMIARPGMARPNRDRPPAREPGTGWLLADDWPEHTRRRAALRAAGGWGAWCDLPPEGDPKRPPKVGAFRAAFLAAYASTPALETAA